MARKRVTDPARGKVRRRDFATREDLAAGLAGAVADWLRRAIDAKGGATLAVSGGTTPALFFAALSREHLDWASVIVTLVDDRFVPPSSDRSNERLAREKLLVAETRLARFVPLCSSVPDVEEAARRAEAGIALLGGSIDVVVLGMGADGHTASFFPDAPNLDALTDTEQSRRVMAVRSPSGGEPRLTLTMPAVVSAGHLALHIEGEAKRDVLAKALAQHAPRLPIARVVDAALAPIDIYWAP